MPDDPVTAREAFPCSHSELALDLSSEAVRLLARAAGGGWTELGAVPLAGNALRPGIDTLRRMTEALGSPPVTLWLPPEQILVRRYALNRGSGDRDEALSRIAADAGHPAVELTVALSPVEEGEIVTVLAAFRRTVEEALDFARRWGFRGGPVSTRVEAERFGTAGPVFQLPKAAPNRGGRSLVIPVAVTGAIAAAAALLVLGLGTWGAQGLLFSADRALEAAPEPTPVIVAAPEVAAQPVEEAFAALGPKLSMVSRTRSQPLEAARPGPERPSEELLLPASYAIARAVALPRPGAPTTGDEPFQLALDSGTADRPHFLHLLEPALPHVALDLAPLMAGIDRIRADGLTEPDATGLAASDVAATDVPGSVPLPAPRPTLSGPIFADGLALEEGPGETEGSDTPAISGSDSRLAVLSAPRPRSRPERSEQSREARADDRSGAGLMRVGNTAIQHGISLEATSLIGVIDARSGRQALLRMPSGDFLRVTRGDEIAGWRVTAIGQDAMRLTRGGESVTLLLVTR